MERPNGCRPLHFLQWHITHGCNLRCVHCYQTDYASHAPRDGLFEALDKYCRFLERRGLRGQINLTGGEPLLHPDFFDLAREIRRRGLRLGVLTNGTLIDDDSARRLAELSPVFVQVSLDGTRDAHDAIRGAGSFDKALSGIDALRGAGVKLLVSFTAQKGNIGELAPLARVCRRHAVNKLWWDRVVTDGPEQTEALALTTPQFRALVKKTNLLRRVYRLLPGHMNVDNGRALQCIGSGEERSYICSAGGNLLILLADGGLMACRRLPFVIGNINDGEIDAIVEDSPIMRELRAPRSPEGCAGCRRFDVCRGGARCVTYAQTGRLDLRDVNCFYDRR